MNKTIITYAAIEHSEIIAYIEKSCFSTPWSENAIKEFICNDSSVVLVAHFGDEIIGYIGMYHTFEEADITNIAVLPSYRNQGVGKALISELISLCKEKSITKIRLEVRESNNSAISLYEKFNFYKVGLRKNYYTHPKENAVLMDLDLITATES